jgi:proteasome lid subunit RPN8/RPN11
MTDTGTPSPAEAPEARADLWIRPDVHEAMVRHALADSPLECCGLLAGRNGRAWAIYPLPNADKSEKRYNAEPQALVRAVQAMRRDGTEIVAIYHSHPKWPAVPSKTDLRENHYGDVPRIIVGLLADPPECRVWRFHDDAEGFHELICRVADFPPEAEPPLT